MKDFLLYLHNHLSRILELHKASEELSAEDQELLASISKTVLLIENYAGHNNDSKLVQILDDMTYGISHIHMRVWFKAEGALKDVVNNISNY